MTLPNLLKLREELAGLEHERWSNWMRYLFACCELNEDGTVTIPKEHGERWIRQMRTRYDQLSEQEKQSDLAEVDRTLAFLQIRGVLRDVENQ